MPSQNNLQIFAVAPPGLEPFLQSELVEKGFKEPSAIAGGVNFSGSWRDVWRANLFLRGASRILVRLATFKVLHLAQLDKKARQLPWWDLLAKETPIRVEASCRKSKIYHSGAAVERVANAARDVAGAVLTEEQGIKILMRIENNQCTISVDTSGELLHKRGFKQAVGKAPIRESMAALLLRACGYEGTEPVVDPMCGSGTIPIEAAEIACGFLPGRGRVFAFEKLSGFDPEAFLEIKQDVVGKSLPDGCKYWGFDRNKGVIEASRANAERARVATCTEFREQPISKLERPDGAPGLVFVNPPYGARIGDRAELRALYQTLGRRLKQEFDGWRAGLITSDDSLARVTGLPFEERRPSFPHGALRVRLYRTGVLGST